MKSFDLPFYSLLLWMTMSCQPNHQWVIDKNEEGVAVFEGDIPILFYQQSPKSLDGNYTRSNYIHPLYGLTNEVLTEDFPEDHYHHRGIFWAWHQIYVGDRRMGDHWATEDFLCRVEKVDTQTFKDSCVLKTQTFWESPNWKDAQGNLKPFAEEEANIVIHTSNANYRVIDFSIKIIALEDSLYIGGSEDAKGYGGFSYRIKLPDGVTFRSEAGEVIPQNLAIDAGEWVEMAGDLTGTGINEGVVVISHPSNPGHPHPWILRQKSSMQNPAYPGQDKVLIPKNEPLQLRYRMVIYQGVVDKGIFSF